MIEVVGSGRSWNVLESWGEPLGLLSTASAVCCRLYRNVCAVRQEGW